MNQIAANSETLVGPHDLRFAEQEPNCVLLAESQYKTIESTFPNNARQKYFGIKQSSKNMFYAVFVCMIRSRFGLFQN